MEDKKWRFIAELGESGSVSAACGAVGICRRTYLRWRKEDADFAGQCDMITESVAAARKEKKARERSERKERGTREGRDKGERRDEIRREERDESGAEDAPPRGFRAIKRMLAEEIRKAMREAGTYGMQWEPQIGLTAGAGAAAMTTEEELDSQGLLQSETTREGDERLRVNPLQDFYLRQLEKYQAGLRALGLNMDTRGSIPQAKGSRDAFFAELLNDD